MRIAILIAAFLLVACSLLGEELSSPVGYWMTIDDKTEKPRSIVEIWQAQNGSLGAKIVKVFPRPDEEENPICTKCKGYNKGKRAIGLNVMWGMNKDGDEYNGGFLLDPDNGETYKGYLKLAEGGQKLNVRGYIGISLFGRTQTWMRHTMKKEEK